eukprot:349452_1
MALRKCTNGQCTNKKCCQCYKCSLNNAINVNSITDQFPQHLIDMIVVDYVGKYVIYGLSNTYQIMPQITPLIDKVEDIHCIENYLLIQNQHCELYLIDLCTDNNRITKLFMNSKSIISFVSNSIKNLFRKTKITCTYKNQQIGKWIFPINLHEYLGIRNSSYQFDYGQAENGYYQLKIPVINSTSFAMYEIDIDTRSNKIKISRMQKMEQHLQKLNIPKNDKIKKFIYFAIINLNLKFEYATCLDKVEMRNILLFESGALIEISRDVHKSPHSWKQHEITAKDIHQFDHGHSDKHNYNKLYVTDSESNLWNLRQTCAENTKFRKVVISENDYKDAYETCELWPRIRDFELCFEHWSNSDNFWQRYFQHFNGYDDVQIVQTAVGDRHIIFMDDKGNLYGLGRNDFHQISIKCDAEIFDEPYPICQDDIGIVHGMDKICRVLASGNKTYFVLNIVS